MVLMSLIHLYLRNLQNLKNRLIMLNTSFLKCRYRSFLMDGELISKYIKIYFKSHNHWISLTINDGYSEFKIEIDEPELNTKQEHDNNFSYPLYICHELEKFLGRNILKIYEYRIIGILDGAIGIYFDYGDKGFSIIEDINNSGLLIIQGVYEYNHISKKACLIDISTDTLHLFS